MFLFCSVKDLWYFFTGFLWSLVSFLRALNFPVSKFMSGSPQSMFSSKCWSSRHFYCPFFSTGLLCFLCRGIFFIVQNECLLAGLYPEGRHDPLLMMGVLLFCHMFAMTWDPSRVDVQGERLAADSSLGARQNRTIWPCRTAQHFVRESKQRDSRRRRLLQMSHK